MYNNVLRDSKIVSYVNKRYSSSFPLYEAYSYLRANFFEVFLYYVMCIFKLFQPVF